MEQVLEILRYSVNLEASRSFDMLIGTTGSQVALPPEVRGMTSLVAGKGFHSLLRNAGVYLSARNPPTLSD